MNTEEQHSCDEILRYNKKLSFKISGQKNQKNYARAKTLVYFRRDRYGNQIRKGGKHRICFKDKIEGEKNRLCEIVNINKICDKEKEIKNDNLQNNSKKNHYKDLKLGNGNDNCSCACVIF